MDANLTNITQEVYQATDKPIYLHSITSTLTFGAEEKCPFIHSQTEVTLHGYKYLNCVVSFDHASRELQCKEHAVRACRHFMTAHLFLWHDTTVKSLLVWLLCSFKHFSEELFHAFQPGCRVSLRAVCMQTWKLKTSVSLFRLYSAVHNLNMNDSLHCLKSEAQNEWQIKSVYSSNFPYSVWCEFSRLLVNCVTVRGNFSKNKP